MQKIQSFEEATKLWSSAVGEFIVEFTQIEQLLHFVLERHLRDSLIKSEHLADSFENRINLMKLILKNKVTEETYLELDKSCQTIMRLKNIRNLLAHNSIVLVVEKNSAGEIRLAEYEVASLKNKRKSIKYAKLIKEIEILKNSVKALAAIIANSTSKKYKKTKH